MAATVEGERLTGQHRRAQQVVRADQVRDTLSLWSMLDVGDIDARRGPWVEAMILSVREHHRESSALAGAYYRTFTAAELDELRDIGRIRPTLDVDRLRGNLEITGPIRFKSLVGRGYEPSRAGRVAQVAAAGAASRFALNGGRDELLGQVRQDRRALGWQRVGAEAPCAFCLMLISRGPVYKGQSTADFESHDNCQCAAEPVMSEAAAWTSQAEQARATWDQVAAGDRDPLNALRRHLTAA